MPTWPAIQNPSYGLQEQPEDAVIRSEFDAGYEHTRPRYTRNRTTWQDISWNAMSTADKQTLDSFYRTTLGNGSLSFQWTHPEHGTVHTVRFTGPPSYTLKTFGLWQVKLSLREV